MAVVARRIRREAGEVPEASQEQIARRLNHFSLPACSEFQPIHGTGSSEPSARMLSREWPSNCGTSDRPPVGHHVCEV